MTRASLDAAAMYVDPKRTYVYDYDILKRSASSNALAPDPKKPREASLDTAAACMNSFSLKRSANRSDDLDEDHKRPIDELPDENTPLDFNSDHDPILDSFLGYEAFDILSNKVENDSELKPMAIEIFQSVKRVFQNGEHVPTLPAQVKNMLKSPKFVQAFLETHLKDPLLLLDIRAWKNKEGDQTRLENLMKDTALEHILQDTGTTNNIKGVLKIIMGYWSNEDFYEELVHATNILYKSKPAEPKVDSVVTMVSFGDLDLPPNTEGLKTALGTKYKGDVYKRLCESVDSQESRFNRMLGPSTPNNRMRRLSLYWNDNDYEVNVIFCAIDNLTWQF